MAPVRNNAKSAKPPLKTGYISVPSVSSDGRRLKERRIPIPLPLDESPIEHEVASSASIHDNPMDLAFNQDFPVPSFQGSLDQAMEEDGLDMEMEDGEQDYIQLDPSAMQKSKEDPLWQMKTHTRKFLQIMMELEGHCGFGASCESCGCASEVSFRCRHCAGNAMFCKSCVLKMHCLMPMHYVEKWNGFYFERIKLRNLSLRVQLGHSPTQTCRNPRPARTAFCIVDVDSIQEVELDFCQCQSVEVVGNSWTQLLRARLFPATVVEPRTAFTFRMLEFFHVATLQSKMTLYDVSHIVATRTDGTGLSEPKDRYHEILRVVRMWRYLKQLKRGGIGCQPDRSLTDINPGELAKLCPACPQPKVNLPKEWRLASNSFIYRKFLAVDACFRLKRRALSSEAKDPGLMTGLAYYVPQEAYQRMMANEPVQVEAPGCEHSMAAVDQASTKFSKGYATTGAVLCLCARHEFVEPNGVVDTNKGEKYWHTDYAISSSQMHSDPDLDYVLSYDINCRYSIRFFTRLDEDLPSEVKFDLRRENWHFVIPKLHIQGHGRPCQEVFLLYLLPGAGETDGEGIERRWADLGGVAGATKEMGPGNRRDTVDDHISSSNWAKTTTLGSVLQNKRRKAREQAEVHQAIFIQFTETQADHWPEWAEQVVEWEQKKSDFNPYAAREVQGDTEASVRLQFAKEEAKQARAGQPSVHEVSPSAFVQTVLELEELQRKLRLDLKDQKWRTETQQTELLERRAKISRQIARVRALQRLYTPIVLEAFPPSPEPSPSPPAEEVITLLPSTLPPSIRPLPVLSKWVDMEIKFRKAQITTALETVRRHLFIRSRLHSQRSLHVRHQQASVRAQQVLSRNDRKIVEAKEKYRAAWNALEALLGVGNVPYNQMRDKDCVAFNDPNNDPLKKARNRRKQANTLFQPRETRKHLSWIWTGVDIGEDSPAMQDALRIEWCKAQARARRWKEELELLEEEMRRVPISLEAEARQWLGWNRGDSEPIAVYCYCQAAIRRGLSSLFQAQWAKPDPPCKEAVLPELPDADETDPSEAEDDDNDED